MSRSTSTVKALAAGSPAVLDDDFCGTSYAAKLLGLSVATVQSLVERGEIEAWKTRGGHRRISLRSVNKHLEKYSARPAAGKRELEGGLRVLIVEDDEATRDLYRSVFEQWSLLTDVTLCSSALDALMDMATLRPDLLITDLNMPGVDGFEMLRAFARNPQLSGMRVLAVTGLGADAIAARGGVPAHAQVLTKPLNLDWLHGFVSALIGARQQARQA